jgi:CheY-like chemotaxis protein
MFLIGIVVSSTAMGRTIGFHWIMRETLVILVAEDNEHDVFLMKRALQKAAISNTIRYVGDGQSLIDYLAGIGQYEDRVSHPLPHFVLLDIQLPGKTGLEALQWMREQPHLNRLPVMIMSSSIEENDIKRAHELGACSYVVKPATAEQLAKELKRFYVFWWPIASSQRSRAEQHQKQILSSIEA